MTKKLKLLEVDTIQDGTIRLQSQLMVGKDSADFILQNNVLKCWGFMPLYGFGFYPSSQPYEIVKTREEMKTQQL